MFNLHIIDVSALLHFGMNSQMYRDKKSCGYNVGGIHKVMRHVAIAAATSDSIVLAFDSKNNFRKQLMPEYKAGRVTNKYVLSQAELLWDYLPKIGIPCYKFESYEGDDIINWCCSDAQQYKRVFIHGNDKDLIHNVRENISFHSITEETNNVSESNFPYAIEKGVYVPFNFISIKKVLSGCPSDRIHAFVSESGIKGADLFQWYLSALEQQKIAFTYNNTTNSELFMRFMHCITALTEKDLQELETRIKVIFPAPKPPDFKMQPAFGYKLNKKELSDFLSLVNDYDTARSFSVPRRDLTNEERDYLRQRQYKITSGEFAVDRNITVNDTFDDNLITLKEF